MIQCIEIASTSDNFFNHACSLYSSCSEAHKSIKLHYGIWWKNLCGAFYDVTMYISAQNKFFGFSFFFSSFYWNMLKEFINQEDSIIHSNITAVWVSNDDIKIGRLYFSSGVQFLYVADPPSKNLSIKFISRLYYYSF